MQLKPYAISQGKLSHWDGENKGYVFSDVPVLNSIIVMVATTIIFFIGIVISWKLVNGVKTLEEDYDADIKRSLFWSSIVVIGLTNIIKY